MNRDLALDGFGNIHGTMGVTAGDYNNDGRMDIFIADWIKQDKTSTRIKARIFFPM